ncbi:MAG: hypothetical protein IJR19_01160 [Lachnospiraceae bacterium]|nr:hypothetical protein [Lachnospiraceae bacterium]
MKQKKHTYVSMKISRMEDDERFVIIGVTNVDDEVRNRRANEKVNDTQGHQAGDQFIKDACRYLQKESGLSCGRG